MSAITDAVDYDDYDINDSNNDNKLYGFNRKHTIMKCVSFFRVYGDMVMIHNIKLSRSTSIETRSPCIIYAIHLDM